MNKENSKLEQTSTDAAKKDASKNEISKDQVTPEDLEFRTDGDFADERDRFGNKPLATGTVANDYDDQLGASDPDDDLTDHQGA